MFERFRRRRAREGDLYASSARVTPRRVVNGDLYSTRRPTARERHRQRMYAAAKTSRLTSGWSTTNSSADAELVSSLTKLRSRSRALVRDSSYAKRARVLVQNNVIGRGVQMQAQVMTARGQINRRVNDAIEREFKRWKEPGRCHTGGRLHFDLIERLSVGQTFEAGELLLRKHPIRFGDSSVPFALEVIESERVADEYQSAFIQAATGNEIRMGVEIDPRFHRPMAYHIRRAHPNEHRFRNQGPEFVERVPAEDVIHLAVIDRWPQTRGEPWLHTTARRLNDMDGYSEAEIVRARAQASVAGVIETPEDVVSFGEGQSDGSVEMVAEPGVYKRLNPGEQMQFPPTSAPNQGLDDFMRYMLREVAAGCGVSYESLSRDYSKTNYSSGRLARLDDTDLWRVLQHWYVLSCRHQIHIAWLQMAVLGRAIPEISVEEYAENPEQFEAARFRPRGWSWVDPTKEVDAARDEIRAGLGTLTERLADKGIDFEEWLIQRQDELSRIESAGIILDSNPADVDMSGSAQTEQTEPQSPDEFDDRSSARLIRIT